MRLSRPVRRFLHGRRGLVESYQVCWQGRGFPQERLCVRVDRYRNRCELVGQVLAMREGGDWQPAHTQTRLLTPAEWEQIGAWVEAGFWQQPGRDAAAPVMDGDCWRIEGWRGGRYHEVYRHSGSLVDGSGAGVYELGKRLARLAGLCHPEGPETGEGVASPSPE
jgi:hypothetical protein